MLGKRRHCCSFKKYLFCLLSLLVVLLFLDQQVYQRSVTEQLGFRYIPKLVWSNELNTTENKLNVSRQIFKTRPAIIANISTHKGAAQSPQKVPHVKTTIADDVEGEHRDNITPGPYRYIINEPDKCSQSRQEPFLVVLITTGGTQEEARNAIRQTWGNESVAPALGFIRLFLLGRNDGELGVLQQKMLEAESNRHHDIIQQDFRDTYNNLTIKTLMGLNWVALHCPQASYVMKTDSDMFVNTEHLIHSVLQPEMKPKTDYFTGYILANQKPFRDKNSKWYMPPELYPGDRYPTFCSGTGYVFSGDLATKVYRASSSVPLIHLEDVYVALCLAKLGVKPTPPPSSALFNNGWVPYSTCRFSRLVTAHGFHPHQLIEYWHLLQSTKHNACNNITM